MSGAGGLLLYERTIYVKLQLKSQDNYITDYIQCICRYTHAIMIRLATTMFFSICLVHLFVVYPSTQIYMCKFAYLYV